MSKPNNNSKSNDKKGSSSKPSRYNPKYRKSNKVKGKDITRPEDRVEHAEGDINDPSYYYGDANVLEQVMNFSFNQFGGVPYDIKGSGTGTVYSAHNYMIATYWLNPSVPNSSPISTQVNMSGASIAALRNYLLLSGSNAKTTSYAPQDVIVLMLAVAELIKVATFCARAFGVAYLFNYRNRSYPESLLHAMGIDVADFNDNLAKYRVRFNKLLAIASKIPFPADVPLFKKASELYANLYLDDPSSALAQTYMFCPNTVWLFDEAYDANGAGLRTTTLVDANTPVAFSSVLYTFETMVAALVNSTSLNSIYSDIMRLAQNGKIGPMITFNSIPEDFIVVPVFNQEIKSWVHNAMIMGNPLATSAQYNPYSEIFTNLNDVCCDANTNSVLYRPQFKLKGEFGYEGLLDFDHDNVSIADKVEATRLSMRWSLTKDTNNNWYTDLLAMADEYVVKATMYTGENLTQIYTLDTSFVNPSTISQTFALTEILSKFDWAPFVYYETSGTMRVIGDLDYYTTIGYDTLRKVYDYEIIHLLQIG